MRLLSATDAITPAIAHTKALLRPFSLKLWLKLGLVALLAEMSGQFMVPPIGNSGHPTSQTSGIAAVAGGITPFLAGVFILIGIIAFIIGLVLFYFASRLQLIFMDLVATRTTLVAPAWHRTASRTWRWIGLKLAFFLVFCIIFGGIVLVPLFFLFRSLPAKGTQQPGANFFATFALIFVIIFLMVLVMMAVIWFTRDFVLPFILFDDATLATALRNASIIIRREPGPVFFYLFMKFVLSLVAGIAAELCILIAALIAAIPLGLIAGTLWFTLHQAGPLSTAIMYISFALLGAAGLAALFVAVVCIVGAVLTFYQAYALYFVGGRIPNLGNLLQPPPPPFIESPPPPSPPRSRYSLFLFRAFTLNQIGLPINPKYSRIWFAKNRSNPKCSFTSLSVNSTNVGGATAACVM
jgi:hypothetical protein